MPEAGYLPIPKKLARQGVKDMVRVSDARMSGTAFGAIVLHVTPEAAAGGPLALVRNGDRIRLSAREKRIDLLVDAAEMERRRLDHKEVGEPRNGDMRASTASRFYRPAKDATSISCDRTAAWTLEVAKALPTRTLPPKAISDIWRAGSASGTSTSRAGAQVDDLSDSLDTRSRPKPTIPFQNR